MAFQLGDVFEESIDESEIDNDILDKETFQRFCSAIKKGQMSDTMLVKLNRLLPKEGRNEFYREVMDQKYLVYQLKDEVFDQNSTLREGASPQQVTAMVGAINNFVSFYIKNLDKIEENRTLYGIETAVIAAVKTLGNDAKVEFLKTLNAEFGRTSEDLGIEK